ncbi:hypothetical protein ElyMa_005131800 [Elysia marginata]|uniref:Uncharacterized protein n=1 Tax=Elysia marginata TaxID=1093978 RepID=A0AAV4JPE1_9GAST|nr:hypothetical protein ElyMa_005131800 [Elysia marginata]
MSASLIYTIIYNATLNTFKGAVFLVMAALCCINVCLLGIFRCLRAGRPLHSAASETDIVTTPPLTVITPPTPTLPLSNNGHVRRRGSHTDDQDNSNNSWTFSANENTPLLS